MKLIKFDSFEEMKNYVQNDISINENITKKTITDLDELYKELNK